MRLYEVKLSVYPFYTLQVCCYRHIEDVHEEDMNEKQQF